MTIEDVKELRRISRNGITSVSVKRSIYAYCKEHGIDSSQAVRVIQKDVPIDKVLELLEMKRHEL